MKLEEIFGSNRTNQAEKQWRTDAEAGKLNRSDDFSSLSSGTFIITPDGKRIGPFKDYDAAASFRSNRPDKVPPGSKIREV